MEYQRAEIRIIVREGNQEGLYWQANLENEDIYYGPPHTSLGPILRGSYHKSGVSHIHLPQGKKVGRTRLLPLGSLTDPIRVVEQGVPWENIKWGYKVKDNPEVRTNLLVDITDEAKGWQPSVELWAIPHGQKQAMSEIISKRERDGDRLMGKVLINTTSPWLLVLVWLPSEEMKEVFERSFS